MEFDQLESYDETVATESMAGKFHGWSETLAFMLAGNATLTFVSGKTGVRYTFKVRLADNKGEGTKSPLYFVSLLSGPDNNADFTYTGVIRMTSHGLPQFQLTRASKLAESSVPVKAFRYVLNALASASMPENVEIWHEGRCGRCGRKLTVPTSIASGFGPECINKRAA